MAGDDQGTIVASVVDEMLNNEELLKTLATRLGLPAATVSRGSMTLGTPEMAHGQEDLLEPPMHLREPADNTGRTTLDLGGGADGGAPGADADAWSDSDDEAGMDLDGELPVDRDGILMRTGGTAGGFALPQDHRDVMLLEHAKREAEEKNQPVRMSGGVHDNVPPLDFRKGRSRITGTSEEEMSEQHIKGMGWRRLPRANLRKSFVGDSGASRTHGPWLEQVNTLGELHSVGMIAPVDAVDYEPDTSTWADPVGTRFVSNVFEDINRVQQGMMKRIEREEKLAQGGGLSQLKMAAATGLTSGDVLALSDGDGNFNEPTEADVIQESEDMAILAARHSNIEKLEEALDNQISVDTTDEHGNTLLMIAGQQGDKRLIKFLLRRGADVHAQNLQGNSVLHYCYEYGHTTLGEYLISKGADSTLLNAQGLTCFEGLSAHNLEKL
uniref:Uncharacterized protein n=1 Tax=Phaeomonas parva TaxID=124430 RepID=A0A7S1XLN4_9STRA